MKTDKQMKVKFEKNSKKKWKIAPSYTIYIDSEEVGYMAFYEGDDDPHVLFLRGWGDYGVGFSWEEMTIAMPIIIEKMKLFKEEVLGENK